VVHGPRTLQVDPRTNSEGGEEVHCVGHFHVKTHLALFWREWPHPQQGLQSPHDVALHGLRVEGQRCDAGRWIVYEQSPQ